MSDYSGQETPMTKTMAEVLAGHQLKLGVRDMQLHCICGWNGGHFHGGPGQFLKHQEAALTDEGFGFRGDLITEWGVRRDADSAVHSLEYAQKTIETQRKRKLKPLLIKRQVGSWELAES